MHPRVALFAVIGVLVVAVAAIAVKGVLSGSDNAIKQDPEPRLFQAASTDGIGRTLDAQQQRAMALARQFLSTHRRADTAGFLRFASAQIPPPPSGSAQRHELDELHRIETTRSTGGVSAAQWLGTHGKKDVWKLYAKQYGQFVGSARGDVARKLLKRTLALANTAEGQVRARFNRRSPYVIDPSLRAIQNESKGKLKASYPSKHTTLAYAALTVLARVEPARLAEYRSMAHQVAYSRLYAGVHYPSDLAAGARLGTLIAEYELATHPGG